jgi:hypothetical protein
VGRVVIRLPAVAQRQITSSVDTVGPSDLHLFRSVKKHADGKPLATDARVKQGVTFCLEALDSYRFEPSLQTLMPW